MSMELVDVTKAVAEFDRVAAGLEALRAKFGGVVYPVATTAGMEEAKAARLEIRGPRYEIERVRKDAKSPLLALGKKLDSEAKRITDELMKLEDPIQLQIASEESRKEREREAKVQAELAHVKDIQDRIENIRQLGVGIDETARDYESVLANAEGLVIDESYAEFRQSAQDAKDATVARLQRARTAAVEREAERERIRLEREELARLRAEQVLRDAADRARREAEEREAKKAREAEEARLAETRRIQREQQDREDAERRRILAEQEAAAKVTRDAEAARQRQEREAHEAQMRREREEQEKAAQAERDRIAEIGRREAAVRAEEQAKIAADRAQLVREQEATRKAAEPAVPTRMRPKAAAIIEAVAKHFGVSNDVAERWLRSTDFGKAQDAA